MGTVPNPWLEWEESDERAAETVVFSRGKSDRIADVASSWYLSRISSEREAVPSVASLRGTLEILGRH